MSSHSEYIEVLLPLALHSTFTYKVPEDFNGRLLPGQRVIVPLGKNKEYIGIVWGTGEQTTGARTITGIMEEPPLLDSNQIRFWSWMADYYLCTPGEVMKAALPARLRNPRYAPLTIPELQPETAPVKPALQPYSLTSEQSQVYRTFLKQTTTRPVQLLYGITSSGKTEIYIHLITQFLKKKQQVLYLLPEIALTTQIITRLQKVFGHQLLVYHSRFSDTKRLEIWNRCGNDPSGEGQVILGVRSSVFLPFRNLGLIIVDEEHENTYKQHDPAPRYHARDCAIVLGQIHHAPVLLGSATPSLETWYHAQTGKYGLLHLTSRYGGIRLPEIILANISEARRKKRMAGPFTPVLLEAIDQALINHQQVMLFQNRRGYSPYLTCLNCGYIPKCTSCDVSLTYHRLQNRLVCHYCGYSTPVPSKCPECQSTGLVSRGLGTEKIEDDIQLIFPDARIARMDLDATRSKTAYERIISDFENRRIDILIGTQMISKGLDFGHVHVVGIMDADQLLNYPDFRSLERSFQLMTQVSGRAGRRKEQGIVIIQSSDPDHPVIRQVLHNQTGSFYDQELAERESFGYPPFTRLLQIKLKHKNPEFLSQAAYYLGRDLKKILPGKVIGPHTPLIGRIQGKHLKIILIKLPKSHDLLQLKKQIRTTLETYHHKPGYSQLIIQPDVDPQ
ncbi:MAG: primosomal protein N' [Bacteroidales bacterium]|nr:primosomal protein N' [Bacteroidales bacterium]